MRVALLTDGIYPYVIGGMQKHSYYLVKYLAKNKIHVDLFHFNQSDLNINALSFFEEEERKYITSIVLEFPSLDKFPGHYIRESYKYSELIFDKIKEKLSTYDFIYTKGFSGWKLIEEKKKGLSCPPIGVKFHGYEMFQFAPDLKTRLQHYLLRKPVRWISENADLVFSYGGKITRIIEEELKVESGKIIEIPTGIEEKWIRQVPFKENNPRRFIFVGRSERRKGIEELNAVLKDLIQEEDFVFEFVGPVPSKKQINSKKIIYHGEIRDAQKIKKILEGTDVLVCPSYSEGMPNVILEGMASGLIIIATDVGAVSAQISKANGILIERGNTLQLKNAVQRCIKSSPSELTKQKESSIERVKELFLWDNIIRKTIDKIRSATS